LRGRDPWDKANQDMKDEGQAADDAPDADALTELLTERYPLPKGEHASVAVDAAARRVAVTLRTKRSRTQIRVGYLRGAGRRDPWMLMVDAMDGLYGMLLENGRAHRELPTGTDVELDGAFFHVEIEHTVPELEKLADQLLGDD
jgi:hypothetical protein